MLWLLHAGIKKSNVKAKDGDKVKHGHGNFS
jgi:hypothetical protein